MKSRVVLVAGAGSGIGRAVALLFAQQGDTVIAADISGDAVLKIAGPMDPGEIHSAQFDATDPAACAALVEDIVSNHGRLDVLVSTIGWTDIHPFVDEDPSYWRRVVDLNLMSSIYLCHAAVRAMREKGGVITLTSSDAGRVGTAGETVYAASKAGVIGLVKSVAREAARYGIRVNAVAPGPTDTPLLEAQGGETLVAKIIPSIPMRRLGTVEDVAGPLVFLSSPAAAYVTGQTLSVSGGLTMSS